MPDLSKLLPPDLPDCPPGWSWRSLLSLADSDRGICYGIVQPGEHDPNGVPIVRADDVSDGSVRTDITRRVTQEIAKKYRRSELHGGELLLTLVGAYFGKVALAPSSLAGFNTARAVGVIPISTHPKYVFVAMRTPLVRHYMQSWANTTAQPTLNLKDVARLPIPWPPQRERGAISDLINALDDKIELNRKMNRTLEAMAQALFKSWFIDFDGHHDLVDSELGPIPRGWEVGTLGAVARLHRSGVDPTTLPPEYPYTGLANMPEGSISLSECGSAKEATSNKNHYSARDILFGKLRPYFKKVAVAPADGVCSSDILVIRPRIDLWQGVILGVLTYDPFIDFTTAVSTGTRMPRVSWKDMSNYKMAIPPYQVATKYNYLISSFVDKIIANDNESRTLTELRDTLLPKLISGELRVPEAEALL